jgi:hypothetical protein
MIYPQTLICESELYGNVCTRYIQPEFLPRGRFRITPRRKFHKIINRRSTLRNRQYTPQQQLPPFCHPKSLADGQSIFPTQEPMRMRSFENLFGSLTEVMDNSR